MKRLLTVLGVMVLGGSAALRAQDLSFQVQVGGNSPDSVALSQGPGGIWVYSSGTLSLDQSTITTAPIPGTAQSGLVINPDPSINYGFGVTNTGTVTQQYTFTFPMPANALSVNLPPGLYAVTATFGNTVTPAPGDTATFSLAPGYTTYQQSFINGTDANVDINVPAGPQATPTGSSIENVSGNTEVFSFASSSTQDNLASTGTTMSVTTTFDLSPGDSASFSGSFTVNSVPEPSSLGLGLLAVLGFAALAVRARRCRS